MGSDGGGGGGGVRDISKGVEMKLEMNAGKIGETETTETKRHRVTVSARSDRASRDDTYSVKELHA